MSERDLSEDVTEPSASVELEAIAELLLSLWRQLRTEEQNVRSMIKRRGRGQPQVAQLLRRTADVLIERGAKLHDAARKIEPALPVKRITPR
jgi:hypothetical protein